MSESLSILLLALIGVGETLYLIHKRKAMQAPICPIGGGCNDVLTSHYSRTLGVPNDLLGLAFYVMVGALAFAMWKGMGLPYPLDSILRAAVLLGSLMSLYLTYLQWQVIKAWCFWCLMSACTIWFMGLILLFLK